MLFYCEFTWHPQTTIAQVRARHGQQYRAEALRPELWRGWYDFAGSGAGFLLVETDNTDDLNTIFQPYADLMRFTVRPVRAIDIEASLARIAERAR